MSRPDTCDWTSTTSPVASQTLVDAHQPVATYDVVWRPASLSAGLYVYRLSADGFPVQTRRAVLLQ